MMSEEETAIVDKALSSFPKKDAALKIIRRELKEARRLHGWLDKVHGRVDNWNLRKTIGRALGYPDE